MIKYRFIRMRMFRKNTVIATMFLLVALFAIFCFISSDGTADISIEDSDLTIAKRNNRHEKEFRMFVVGDTGGIPIFETTKVQKTVAKTMAALATNSPVDTVLNLGDNIYYTGVLDVNDERFKSRFEHVYTDPALEVKWLMMAGNHDHFGNISAQIEYTKRSNKWYYPALYYNMTYMVKDMKIEIVVIDTIELCGNTRDVENGGFFDMMLASKTDPKGPKDPIKAQQQMTWIEKILQNSDADYLIVAGHYPIHSMSSHGPIFCLQTKLDPLLSKYNVSIYFSGHDHNLQHFQYEQLSKHTVNYIVSGAASRTDSSDKNIYPYMKGDHLKFHYPTSGMFSAFHLGQLGFFTNGGFVYANFHKTLAKLDFYDKKGRNLYLAEIQPRYLKCSSRNKQNC
ncbi:hypothetical protein WR25_19210 [Diploscapter pachys]|uniref:Tartrate-resistant acid phosphatase type 5 n=1 Tax=Diploscapter pachys TaxID=2018661 RepID=A0A2A2KRH0_9BILA|nr:hypothetical protein WR25_19210 [Diploscapter pachys]